MIVSVINLASKQLASVSEELYRQAKISFPSNLHYGTIVLANVKTTREKHSS